MGIESKNQRPKNSPFQIPPRAAHRRVPLDPRLNALGPWREAVDRFIAPDDENGAWARLIHGGQVPPFFNSLADRKAARDALQQNAACLDALDRGLKRGQLQFAEFESLEQTASETDFISRLDEIAGLRQLRFQLWLVEGDLVAAAEEIFRLEQIGLMICRGEGQMLHYLVGLRLRTAAVRSFGLLAADERMPGVVLERVLETLDDGLTAADGLAESLCVDLATITLAQLDRMADRAAPEAMIDKLLEVYYAPSYAAAAKLREPDYATIAEGWLRERRQQILLLLDGHPRPFDKGATAQLMGRSVAETIGDLHLLRRPELLHVVSRLHCMRCKMRLYRLSRQTRGWPVELTPRAPIDISAGSELKSSADSRITTVRLPRESLTLARLTVLQARLRRVENPVGLMLARHFMAHDYAPYLFNHLATIKNMRRLVKRRVALGLDQV